MESFFCAFAAKISAILVHALSPSMKNLSIDSELKWKKWDSGGRACSGIGFSYGILAGDGPQHPPQHPPQHEQQFSKRFTSVTNISYH